MKLLGHAWVAVQARPQGNQQNLILGSILPEVMYYTEQHPFKFEEIHEGGDKVFWYLRKNDPEWADLGLGMLAHSVKAGADKYNLDENLAILGYQGCQINNLRQSLTETLNISYETATVRAHNILELAIELNLIDRYPSFVKDFKKTITDKQAIEKTIGILAGCFNKPRYNVAESIHELFDKTKPDYFKDAAGLANLWAELARVFDPPPNKQALAGLLRELAVGFQGKDKVFLEECTAWVKSNLQQIASPSRLLRNNIST